jgi:hypothetical protein
MGESRQFKLVFDQAQKVLTETFGMMLTELPVREKVTIQQRRGEFTSFSISLEIGQRDCAEEAGSDMCDFAIF